MNMDMNNVTEVNSLFEKCINYTPKPEDSNLKVRSIIVLSAFIVQTWLSSFPLTFKLRAKYLPKFIGRDVELCLDLAWGSLLVLFILLVTTTIGWNQIYYGVFGDEVIRPYTIIVIFFSLAYSCLSLDETGVFRYMAERSAQMSHGHPFILFLIFYTLSAFLTLFTSNDMVVMTITPVILYYTNAKGLNAKPYLMAQFFAANTWSVILVVGNPTNIIVAAAEKMDFIEYMVYLSIPGLVGGILSFILLYLFYSRDIHFKSATAHITSSLDSTDSHAVPSVRSAIVSSIIFAFGLIILVVSSFTESSMWIPTIITAAFMAIKDLSVDVHRKFWLPAEDEKPLESFELITEDEQFAKSSLVALDGMKKENGVRFLYLRRIMFKMPWKMIPYIFVMFILVQAMNDTGWVARMALGFKEVARGNYYETALAVLFISAFLCALVNNQPITVMLTRVLFHPNFRCFVLDEHRRIALYALIVGSNYGSNLSLNGGLAGLMWDTILKAKNGPKITYLYFSGVGLLIMVPTMVIAAVLIAAI